MGEGGPPHHYLGAIRDRYPVSLHGVGLSIGGAGALDREHLCRLKALIERYQPALFSEHLAWSSHDSVYLNDLLPLPYTEETLTRVCEHIDEVQDRLRAAHAARDIPSTVCGLSRDAGDERGRSSCARWCGAPAAGFCSTSTIVRTVGQSRVRRRRVHRLISRCEHVGEIHLGGHAARGRRGCARRAAKARGRDQAAASRGRALHPGAQREEDVGRGRRHRRGGGARLRA